MFVRDRRQTFFPSSSSTLVLPLLLLSTFLACGVSFAQDTQNRARQALEAGQLPEAIRLLEQYRTANSANAEVYNLLGIAYGRSGESGRAVAMFEEYVRLTPGRPRAFNNLGAAYLQNGNPEKAELAFRQSLKLDPANVGALYNLGALLNSQKKYAESVPLLGRAYRAEKSPGIVYEFAVALAGTGQRGKALAILSAAKPPEGPAAVPWLRLTSTLRLDQGNVAAAFRALKSAMALAPDDEASLSLLALLRLKEGRPDLAIGPLEKIYKDLPADQKLIRIGSFLASSGAYAQALDQFEQAAKQNPLSYDACFNIAVIKLDQIKDLPGALAAARQAAGLRNTGEIHNLLGDIREAQGSILEAVNEYQEATRLDPENIKFVFDLGAELILHENYAAALAVYQSAEVRFPDSSRIFLGLGTVQFLSGKTDESVGAFLKAVDLDPTFEPAYVFLGEACTFSGTRSGQVAAKLATLAAKDPKNFGAQYYLGAVLIRQMDQDGNVTLLREATAALDKAALLKPKDVRVYYQRGELFRLQSKFAESIRQYTAASELDPDFPEPLYKLGQVYLKLHKPDESKASFARHKEVLKRTEANLYRRSSEIQSFVLTMRKTK
jgi:tetratricopeptide (TPR) repeat protein